MPGVLAAGALTLGTLALGPSIAGSEAGFAAARTRTRATTTVVVTTAPERRTTAAAERLRVLTTTLGRSAGVAVTAPTCPAGVRTDRPTEYSCVVGFAGVVVAFYVREVDGVEQIRAAMPVIPTRVLNRAAGSGAVCASTKIVVVPVGTAVTCRTGRRTETSVTVTEDLARPWLIDTSAREVISPARPTTSSAR